MLSISLKEVDAIAGLFISTVIILSSIQDIIHKYYPYSSLIVYNIQYRKGNNMSYVEKPRWTAQQSNFIRANYQNMSDEQIGMVLGRTKKSVRRKRENMGLKKEMGKVVYGSISEIMAKNKNLLGN